MYVSVDLSDLLHSYSSLPWFMILTLIKNMQLNEQFLQLNWGLLV